MEQASESSFTISARAGFFGRFDVLEKVSCAGDAEGAFDIFLIAEAGQAVVEKPIIMSLHINYGLPRSATIDVLMLWKPTERNEQGWPHSVACRMIEI